jgi:chaperonin GroES
MEMATKSALKIRPINDKLLVQRLEAEETTKGGIVIPDSAKEKPREGKIVAMGDGKLLESGERQSFQVKVGDRVLFTSYAGSDIKVDGEEYLVLEESDILAIVG